MRLAKGYAATNKVVGGVGGEQGRIGSGGTEAVFAEFGVGERASGDGEHVVDLIVRGEEGFLIFLQDRAGSWWAGPFSVVNRAKSAPVMRPVLPRRSSQESGFFFCGMRLLPVEYSSGRIT